MPGKPPAGMSSMHIHSGDMVLVSPNGTLDTRRVLVTSTPQQISTILNDRKILRVMVLGNSDVYIGEDNSVASGDGWPVFSNTWQDFGLGPNIKPYIMQASGTGDVRVMEVS